MLIVNLGPGARSDAKQKGGWRGVFVFPLPPLFSPPFPCALRRHWGCEDRLPIAGGRPQSRPLPPFFFSPSPILIEADGAKKLFDSLAIRCSSPSGKEHLALDSRPLLPFFLFFFPFRCAAQISMRRGVPDRCPRADAGRNINESVA